MIPSMLFFVLLLTLCCNVANAFISVNHGICRHLHCWQERAKETGPRPRKAGNRIQKSDDDQSIRDASGVNEDLVNRIFMVVGKFGIAEDAIRKVLNLESINSEADLSDVAEIGRISGALCFASDIKYSEQVKEALTDEFVDKDGYKLGKLHGKRIFKPDIFTGRLTQETYVKEAACYTGPEFGTNEEDLRPKNFAVVLGASGAGKSAFALFGLPDLVFPGQNSLAILIEADSVTKDRAADVQEDPDQFGRELRKEIEKEIQNTAHHPWQPLKCPLLIVLDEGAKSGPFSDVRNFRTIVSYLTELSEKSSFLVVTGVGLDKVTQRIDSLTDMKKFRMQDWDAKRVQLLIKKWNNTKKQDFAMKLLNASGTLQSIITNARCAAYLVTALANYIIPADPNTKDDYVLLSNVDILLKYVSYEYIATNGLRRLSQQERFRVVCALFLTVEESLQEPGRAFFPKVPENLNTFEKEAWWGFLNINVESKEGETNFVNENGKGSVSVSPALALVAAAIVDPIGLESSADWQGLEEVAGFGEVKHYLVSCKNEFNPGSSKLLVRSKVGYPVVRKNDKALATAIEFPDVTASGMVVMINGPFASFADVVAPHRLVQVKQTATGVADIDLKEELGKMGCTKDKSYTMQQVYLHYLAHVWNREATPQQLGASSGQIKPEHQEYPRLESRKVHTPSQYYPFDQVQQTQKPLAFPTLCAQLSLSSSSQEPSTSTGSKMMWKIQVGTKVEPTSLEIDPLSDLPYTEPICAVFFTNANTIHLVKGEEITSIDRCDVCRLGILKNQETKKAIKAQYKVKKNIEVRFLFGP